MTQAAQPAARQALNLTEAAEYHGVTQKTIRRLIASGQLPAYRVANTRAIRVRVADLDAIAVPVTQVSA